MALPLAGPFKYGVRFGERHMKSWEPAARVSYERLVCHLWGLCVLVSGRTWGESQVAVGVTLLGRLTDNTSSWDPQMGLPPGALGKQNLTLSKASTTSLTTTRTRSHIPAGGPICGDAHLCAYVSTCTDVSSVHVCACVWGPEVNLDVFFC